MDQTPEKIFMKKIKGELCYYFATGEFGRPQFIGNNSVNAEGRVINFEEVYDIQIGDRVNFISGPLKHVTGFRVHHDLYIFLEWLTAMYRGDEKLEVEYTPAKKTKSWAQHIK